MPVSGTDFLKYTRTAFTDLLQIHDMSSPGVRMGGVICPILTPFNHDRSFCAELYVQHAHWLLDEGIHYISPFGTTGEALSLSVAERMKAVETLIDDGIDPGVLMPGAGLCNLPESLELVRHAMDAGCAAVMMLPPFYIKPVSDEGLYTYFASLVEAAGGSRLKICLYHIPPMATTGFSPGLTERLAMDFPGVVIAYKDSSGDWENTLSIRGVAPDISVFPGSERFLRRGLENGCAGCISATCNINPAGIREAYDAMVSHDMSGDLDRIENRMLSIRKSVEVYAPIPVMKGVLSRQYNDDRWANVRSPLMPAPDQDVAALIRTRADFA